MTRALFPTLRFLLLGGLLLAGRPALAQMAQTQITQTQMAQTQMAQTQMAQVQVAQAQAAPPPIATPMELRGAWFRGGCADPEAMMQVTARAVARLPASGPARLLRLTEMREGQGEARGWSIGTGRGAEAPRVMLRGAPAALETAEPDAKLRDDRLPGETPVLRWQRCPIPPPAFAALHGEGLAILSSMEMLEAACGGAGASIAGCVAALMAEGDVSGDRLLSVAEIARLVRGLTWVLAASEDAAPEGVVAASGGGVLAGVAVARLAMENLDYDGDGKLSATELAQDRASFSRATGSEAGRPLRLEGVQEGLGVLRSLLDGLLYGD